MVRLRWRPLKPARHCSSRFPIDLVRAFQEFPELNPEDPLRVKNPFCGAMESGGTISNHPRQHSTHSYNCEIGTPNDLSVVACAAALEIKGIKLQTIKNPARGRGLYQRAGSVCRKSHQTNRVVSNVVPRRGLEPPRVAPLAPEASASTNSATWANPCSAAPIRGAKDTWRFANCQSSEAQNNEIRCGRGRIRLQSRLWCSSLTAIHGEILSEKENCRRQEVA
jgi:hypothetical protein